jgi:hypothetical protein
VNDPRVVGRALRVLEREGVRAWVAGGWAEQLRGLCAPRPHADIDLLLPAPRFDLLDAIDLDWIDAKRYPWKRAFSLDEVMVEVLLVECDDRGRFSAVRGRRHRWPADVLGSVGRTRVASAAALRSYRRAYPSLSRLPA